MLRAGNFYGGDGCAFQRGKQHTSEGVPNRVTITGLKWLGDKLCVGICGCALVLCESLWHFKTTVTDWHMLVSDCRVPIYDLRRERRVGDPLTIENLHLKSAIDLPGSP